jgi:hypothetical protein
MKCSLKRSQNAERLHSLAPREGATTWNSGVIAASSEVLLLASRAQVS